MMKLEANLMELRHKYEAAKSDKSIKKELDEIEQKFHK
jgi:hypothetical protein